MGLGFGLASVATPSYLSEVVVPVRDHGDGIGVKDGESHYFQVTLSPPKRFTKRQIDQYLSRNCCSTDSLRRIGLIPDQLFDLIQGLSQTGLYGLAGS